jgi:hypothetical protein
MPETACIRLEYKRPSAQVDRRSNASMSAACQVAEARRDVHRASSTRERRRERATIATLAYRYEPRPFRCERTRATLNACECFFGIRPACAGTREHQARERGWRDFDAPREAAPESGVAIRHDARSRALLNAPNGYEPESRRDSQATRDLGSLELDCEGRAHPPIGTEVAHVVIARAAGRVKPDTACDPTIVYGFH